jgi:hypothetical protein
MPNYTIVIPTPPDPPLGGQMDRPNPAWAALTAGIPLTLLLDLAAAVALDSPAILAEEQAAALVSAAWAEVAGPRRHAGSGAA